MDSQGWRSTDPRKLESADKARLARRLDAIRSLLTALCDELADFVDTEDGSNGEPRPNWAMRLCANAETELEHLERLLGVSHE